MKIKITAAAAAGRLDVFLTPALQQSRSQVQRLVKDGLVTVNGQPAKSNYQLKSGDVLAVSQPAGAKELARLKPLPAIKIIKDTADYLVLNKPAGLLVHAAAGKRELTLADWLIKYYPEIKTVGDDPARPGIVHRLDREVSGLMVAAKTPAAFASLKQQFQSRAIVKEYRALVYGVLTEDSGVINFLLGRGPRGKMAARPLGQSGKEAITEYQVLKRFINYTYLRLLIKTGRTHQIRAHLAALDHAVVGDNLYGSKAARAKNKKLNLGRLWLVATRLAFRDLQGKQQEFKINLPPELKIFLTAVK